MCLNFCNFLPSNSRFCTHKCGCICIYLSLNTVVLRELRRMRMKANPISMFDYTAANNKLSRGEI